MLWRKKGKDLLCGLKASLAIFRWYWYLIQFAGHSSVYKLHLWQQRGSKGQRGRGRGKPFWLLLRQRMLHCSADSWGGQHFAVDWWQVHVGPNKVDEESIWQPFCPLLWADLCRISTRITCCSFHLDIMSVMMLVLQKASDPSQLHGSCFSKMISGALLTRPFIEFSLSWMSLVIFPCRHCWWLLEMWLWCTVVMEACCLGDPQSKAMDLPSQLASK